MSAFRLKTLQKIGRADNIELESSDSLISSPKLIKRNIRTNPNINSNKPSTSFSKHEKDAFEGSIRSILSSSMDNDVNDDDVVVKEDKCDNENESNKLFLDACTILSLLTPTFSSIGPNEYFSFHQNSSPITTNIFTSGQLYEQSSFTLDQSAVGIRVNQMQTSTHNWKAGRLAYKLTDLKRLVEKRKLLIKKYNLINVAIHLRQTEHMLEDMHNRDSANICLEYSLEDLKTLAISNLYEVCDELRIEHHAVESIPKYVKKFSNVHFQYKQLKSIKNFSSDLFSNRVHLCLHRNNLMWTSSCIKAGITALSRVDADMINCIVIARILRGVQDFNYLVSICPKIASELDCISLIDLVNEISQGHGNLAAMSFFEFILSISQDQSHLIQYDEFWILNREMYELLDCNLDMNFDLQLATINTNLQLINLSAVISPLSDFIRRENLFIDEFFRSVCHATKFLTTNSSKLNILSELTTDYNQDSSIQSSKHNKKVSWNDENLSIKAKAISGDFVINLWTCFGRRLEDFHMDSSVIVTLNQNQFETQVACITCNRWSAAIVLRQILISSTNSYCVPAMLKPYLRDVARSISSISALSFIIQSFASIVAVTTSTNQSENNTFEIMNNFEFINQSEVTLKLIDACDLILADAVLFGKCDISVINIIVSLMEKMVVSIDDLLNRIEMMNSYMSIFFIKIMNRMPIICHRLQTSFNYLKRVLSLLSKNDHENNLLIQCCTISYKNIEICMANILGFSSDMRKKFMRGFSSKCRQYFLENLPNSKLWQQQLDKHHNAYIENAMSDILAPTFALILNLDTNISNKYLNANMNVKEGELNIKEYILRIFGEEWMKSILLKKIKFSYEGACLLERDVKFVRDWLQKKPSCISIINSSPDLLSITSQAFSLKSESKEEDTVTIIADDDKCMPVSPMVSKDNDSLKTFFNNYDSLATLSTDGLSDLDAVVSLLKQQPVSNKLQQQGLINSFQKAFSSVIDLRKFDLIRNNLSPTHSFQAMPTSGINLSGDSNSSSQTLKSDNQKYLNYNTADTNLSSGPVSPTNGISLKDFNGFNNCNKTANNIIREEKQRSTTLSLLPEVTCQKSNEINYGIYAEVDNSNDEAGYEDNLNLSPVLSSSIPLNKDGFSFAIPIKKETTTAVEAISSNIETTTVIRDAISSKSDETRNDVVHRNKWLRLRLNGAGGEKKRRTNVRWVRFIALCLGNSANHSSTEDSSTVDNNLLV